MPRYLITIEYDGSDYVGWQRQDNGPSVQAALEAAATAIIGGRQQVAVQGAGRTDAGVHATGQAAHFDLPETFDTAKLPLALNAHLPPSVRVLLARSVADTFNARFDAIGRRIGTGYGHGASRRRLNGGGSGLSAVNWMLPRWKPAQPI